MLLGKKFLRASQGIKYVIFHENKTTIRIHFERMKKVNFDGR